MSANPVDPQALEEKRQQINRLIEEIARLAESQVAPPEFCAEFLQRILVALAAPSGVIWNRTAQGNLQLQFQTNMGKCGLESEEARQAHHELLRQVCQTGKPLLVVGGCAATTRRTSSAGPGPKFLILTTVPT